MTRDRTALIQSFFPGRDVRFVRRHKDTESHFVLNGRDRLYRPLRTEIVAHQRRYAWIKSRNALISVLKWCGVGIDRRCQLANRIIEMVWRFPGPPKRY